MWVKKNVGQIFLHFSNIGFKLRLDAENQVPTCPRSGLKVCGGGGGVCVGKPNLVLRFGW